MSLVECPDCHRPISDSAPTCLGCGRPMMSFLSQPPTGVTLVTASPPRSATPALAMVTFLVGVLVLAGAVAWRAWGAGAAAAGAPTSGGLRLGDVGVLHSLEALPTVMLFDRREDFEAAAKATAAKDDATFKQLVRSRATFAPTGTKGREVEAVFEGGIRVQLVDGPRPGFVGWTFTECLQPK